MRLYKRTQDVVNNIGDNVLDILRTDIWMGLLWVGLGLTTWYNNPISDVFTVGGPILVGILLMVPIKKRNGVYFIFGFVVVADRTLAYMVLGLWNPLFVWLIVGTYVLNAIGDRHR